MSSSSESSSEDSPIPSKRRRQRHDTDSEDDISNSPSSHLRDMCDDSYSMDGDWRGIALVFNNGSNTRNGSYRDCIDLCCLFIDLKLTPMVFPDQDKEDKLYDNERYTQMQIQSYAQIMFIVFMSHGDENGIITNDNQRIDIDTDVIPRLCNDVAPLLANKPKIILQQACRGPNLDSGVSISNLEFPTSATPAQLPRQRRFLPTSPTIPTQSEICIVYSSPMGFKSLCHPEEGVLVDPGPCQYHKKILKSSYLWRVVPNV